MKLQERLTLDNSRSILAKINELEPGELNYPTRVEVSGWDDQPDVIELAYATGNRLLTEVTDHKARKFISKVIFEYDERNRLVVARVAEPDTFRTTYEYDDQDRLAKVTTGTHKTFKMDSSFTYGFGWAREISRCSGYEEKRPRMKYNGRTYYLVDQDERITAVIDDTTNEVVNESDLLAQYEYNEEGRLARIQHQEGVATVYEYTGNEVLVNTEVNLPEMGVDNYVGLKERRVYDDLGRLASRTHVWSDGHNGVEIVEKLTY